MKKISKEEFINRSSSIHNNKYDYSKVNFINVRTKVCIICPEHGEFWQTPYNHIWAKKMIVHYVQLKTEQTHKQNLYQILY